MERVVVASDVGSVKTWIDLAREVDIAWGPNAEDTSVLFEQLRWRAWISG